MNCVLLDTDHWKYVMRDGLPLIKIKCLQCNEWGDLIDHTIDDQGFINPSVICGASGCDWHVMAALKDFVRKP